MIIVVDTNILISALITPDGSLAEVLTLPQPHLKRITCHYLLSEITRHFDKVVRQSKRDAVRIHEDLLAYLQYITLYDETVILPIHWQEADRLTQGVDSDDIMFVALALQTGGLLWTGDKKLMEHLKSMGFDHVVNTPELAMLIGNQ